MTFTAMDAFRLLGTRTATIPTDVFWRVSPTFIRKLRRISLKARKRLPVARALRRSVHRAYRKAGLPLPQVMRMTENGKGDTPRPIVVDPETFKKNWERTFRVCPGYGIGPCDMMGPDNSCAACGQPYKNSNDA